MPRSRSYGLAVSRWCWTWVDGLRKSLVDPNTSPDGPPSAWPVSTEVLFSRTSRLDLLHSGRSWHRPVPSYACNGAKRIAERLVDQSPLPTGDLIPCVGAPTSLGPKGSMYHHIMHQSIVPRSHVLQSCATLQGIRADLQSGQTLNNRPFVEAGQSHSIAFPAVWRISLVGRQTFYGFQVQVQNAAIYVRTQLDEWPAA